MLPTADRSFLSPKQIAGRYGIGVDSVYVWITKGMVVHGREIRLEAIRVGKSWRVPVEGWDAFLAAKRPRRRTGRPPRGCASGSSR